MSETPMHVSYNATITDPTPANPSPHLNPSVGIKKPQYMNTNQGRPTGSGIHNKPGVDIWAGSAFGKSISVEVVAPSTYQGCDCITCKEMNVDCPDCPVCANPIDSEIAMAMYDSSLGKLDPLTPNNPMLPTDTYQHCECATCVEEGITCSMCPQCNGGMDAQTEIEEPQGLGKADPCWEGYVMRGMKPGTNGKPVPNCVPVSKTESILFSAKDYTKDTRIDRIF